MNYVDACESVCAVFAYGVGIRPAFSQNRAIRCATPPPNPIPPEKMFVAEIVAIATAVNVVRRR